MKVRQRVEVVNVGNATLGAVLPSGAPYGQLIGRRGVVVATSLKYNGSWVVQFEDGIEYDLHEEQLVVIEEMRVEEWNDGSWDGDQPVGLPEEIVRKDGTSIGPWVWWVSYHGDRVRTFEAGIVYNVKKYLHNQAVLESCHSYKNPPAWKWMLIENVPVPPEQP